MEFPIEKIDNAGSAVTDEWISEMMIDDFTVPEKVEKHCVKCNTNAFVATWASFCQICGRQFTNLVVSKDSSTQTPAVWMTEGDVMPESIVFSQCGTNGTQLCTLKSFKSSFTVWPTTKLLDGPISNQITICRVMVSYWYKNLLLFCPWLDPKTSLCKETMDSRPDEGDEAVECCVNRLTKMPDQPLRQFN